MIAIGEPAAVMGLFGQQFTKPCLCMVFKTVAASAGSACIQVKQLQQVMRMIGSSRVDRDDDDTAGHFALLIVLGFKSVADTLDRLNMARDIVCVPNLTTQSQDVIIDCLLITDVIPAPGSV